MAEIKESKIFAADIEMLPQVTDFVEETMGMADVPMKAVSAILICLEEIFVNVCHYAYPPGTGKAQVDVWIEENAVQIKIADSGVEFNPLERDEPDVTLDPEERKIGGLGIYMTRKMMDEVYYSYKDGQNIFTMVKKF